MQEWHAQTQGPPLGPVKPALHEQLVMPMVPLALVALLAGQTMHEELPSAGLYELMGQAVRHMHAGEYVHGCNDGTMRRMCTDHCRARHWGR
jgi:hypothetical protein